MPNPKPTLSDAKELLQIPAADTSKDSLISRLLNGAIDYVERATQREFSTGIGTRYFDGNGRGYLLVDDFQRGSITHIAILRPDRSDETIIATGNICTRGERSLDQFHNRIEIINAPTENPHRVIGPSPYVFPAGSQNIEITATWGTWDILPDGLQNLILDLVKNKVSAPAGNIRSMSVGGESLAFGESDFSIEQRRVLQIYAKPMVEIFPS